MWKVWLSVSDFISQFFANFLVFFPVDTLAFLPAVIYLLTPRALLQSDRLLVAHSARPLLLHILPKALVLWDAILIKLSFRNVDILPIHIPKFLRLLFRFEAHKQRKISGQMLTF